MRGTWSLVLTAAIGIILLVWLSWLFRPTDPDAHIRDIAADLQRRTIVPGARQEGDIEIERTKLSIKVAWEVQADLAWDGYQQAIIKEFADFKVQSKDDAKIVFVKQLPGDTYHVTVKKVSAEPMRVRVTFIGYPS